MRISVWVNRDTCHNIVKRHVASSLKKGVIAHLWILAVVSQQEAFLRTPHCHPQISIWL